MFHLEISQLIDSGNYLPGFYVSKTLYLNGLIILTQA